MTALIQPGFCEPANVFSILRKARQRVVNVLFRPSIEIHVSLGGLKLLVRVFEWLVDDVVRKRPKAVGIHPARLIVVRLRIQPADWPVIPSRRTPSPASRIL